MKKTWQILILDQAGTISATAGLQAAPTGIDPQGSHTLAQPAL